MDIVHLQSVGPKPAVQKYEGLEDVTVYEMIISDQRESLGSKGRGRRRRMRMMRKSCEVFESI